MSIRKHAAQELITYVFGVLYAATVVTIHNPDTYKSLRLGMLEKVATGSLRVQRIAQRIGDGALDLYRKEIGG
jgi:hypothetical protein